MPDHYRVIDYDGGRRLESLQLAQSAAATEPGFLRLFYSLNSKAPRGYFGVRLHDDGADILRPDGTTQTAFMRVPDGELGRWRGH